MNKSILVLFLFSTTLLITCSSDNKISEEELRQNALNRQVNLIDSLIHQLNIQDNFNGAVLVAHDGREIFSNAYGFENFETRARMTTQSAFRLNLLSLQMTAMGIMMLEEKGSLSYDDEIQKYIPEISYEGVTIRNLLWHTSGIPDYMSYIYNDSTNTEVRYNKDVLDLMVELNLDLESDPGEWWAYSSTGYVLLAIIIERVSGKTFSDFMSKSIFEPLEMNHTYCTNGDPNQGIPNRVFGYNKEKELIDWDITNGVIGDGGIYSSVEDLFKWDKALYTEILVSKETLKEMYAPYKLNKFDDSTEDYGFGVDLHFRHGNHHIDVEDAAWLGFYNYFSRNLKNKATIIILTNVEADPSYIADFIEDIVDEF